MKEILQRLEVVKNAIMLEDEDIISLQINKLSQLALDADAVSILTLLKSGSFESVIGLIEEYRHSKMGLINYEDKEVYGLRLELKMMEAEYEELSIQKITIESLLNDFNHQYYHYCGKLIESILSYRAAFQQKEAKANPEDQDKADAFNDAQKDYEDFHTDYKEKTESPLVDLSDSEQRALKAAYRKASSLCHPDKVSDEFKDQAGEIFKQLNDAYKTKNLKAVNEILAALQNQDGFTTFSDTVSNVEKLRLRITKLKKDITAIKKDIAMIKGDETYQLIETIPDWKAYFNDTKDSLEQQLSLLKEQSSLL